MLFWSTNYTDFHPQQTATLAASPAWTDITNTLTVVGAEYQLALGPPNGRQFYRRPRPRGPPRRGRSWASLSRGQPYRLD
jgi:hypothetical protein